MRAINATFNYTQRKRIRRENVQFRALVGDSGPFIEMTKLNINDLDLPPEGILVVECRSPRRRLHRLEFGTVSSPSLGAGVELPEPTADGIALSLKVVGTQSKDKGKILAKCDGLRPQFSGHTESLLAIVPFDLGQRLWNLNFDSENGPELQINADFVDLMPVWSSPVFQSLVLPSVVKSIALWLIDNQDTGDDDPLGIVVNEWKGLIGSWGYDVAGVNPNDEDQIANWADEVSTSFALKQRYFDTVKGAFSVEADE